VCCPLMIILFFGPRTALIYLWLVGYLDGVFATFFWPLVGFIFLPFTMIVYAIAAHHGGLSDFSLVMVVVAALVDLGVLGGSDWERRRRIID